MNNDNCFKKYILFWLSQSISQLGSAMTSFALILWVYMQEGSAMTVSLMSFFNYVPYVMASLFAGAFADSHKKKNIMLVSDSIAALCSAVTACLTLRGSLQIGHIYIVNFVIGFMNAFQAPASAVAIGKLVPKDKLARVSGMNAFSNNLIAVLAPILAGSLFAFGGLRLLLCIDLLSFMAAFFVLLFVIKIPENEQGKAKKRAVFSECMEGFRYLKNNRGILVIMLTLALLNFFSSLTYENILSPMILARSGNNSVALGIVNAAMGIGGIVGGILVTIGKLSKDNVKMIYVSAVLSFLLGDVIMGMGQNAVLWSFAAVAASLPMPFINAGQNVILYQKVPQEIQGRVFSVRNAVQFATIPAGILLGGFLADYAFEPFMQTQNSVSMFLCRLVGSGAGSGMAVMFLCTGILGSFFSFVSYNLNDIQKLRYQ